MKRSYAAKATGDLEVYIVLSAGGESYYGAGICGVGGCRAVTYRPVESEVARTCALVQQLACKRSATRGRLLIESKIRLDAVHYPDITILGYRVGTSAGIGDGERYIIVSRLRIGM